MILSTGDGLLPLVGPGRVIGTYLGDCTSRKDDLGAGFWKEIVWAEGTAAAYGI